MDNNKELNFKDDWDYGIDAFNIVTDEVYLPEDIKIQCIETIMWKGPRREDSVFDCCRGISFYLKERRRSSKQETINYLKAWYTSNPETITMSKIDFMKGVKEILEDYYKFRFYCKDYPVFKQYCNKTLCVFCQLMHTPKFEGEIWESLGESKYLAFCLYDRFIMFRNKFSKKALSFTHDRCKAFFVTHEQLTVENGKQLISPESVRKGIRLLKEVGLVVQIPFEKILPYILKHYHQDKKSKVPNWYILPPYYRVLLKYKKRST